MTPDPRESSSSVNNANAHSDADAGNGPSPQSPPRIFYRNANEFDQAMSKAAERLRENRKQDWLYKSIGIFWIVTVVIGVLALILNMADRWPFDQWIDGGEFFKICVLAFILACILHEVVVKAAAPEVIARRLCLKCNTPLRQVEVDDDGDGVCPECERDFNIAEYQHPDERTGSEFAGYLDEKHYRESLRNAAVRIHSLTFMPIERRFLDIVFWVILAGLLGDVWLDWYEIDWPNDIPIAASVGFPTWGLWCAWYWWRVQRIEGWIVHERLCLGCGYSLKGTPFDEESQTARCPECARIVHALEYEPPTPGEADDPESPTPTSPSDDES